MRPDVRTIQDDGDQLVGGGEGGGVRGVQVVAVSNLQKQKRKKEMFVHLSLEILRVLAISAEDLLGDVNLEIIL